MRNESSLLLDEFKEQIVKQIKTNAPSSNITKENITIKVKISKDDEPIDFYSLRITIDM